MAPPSSRRRLFLRRALFPRGRVHSNQGLGECVQCSRLVIRAYGPRLDRAAAIHQVLSSCCAAYSNRRTEVLLVQGKNEAEQSAIPAYGHALPRNSLLENRNECRS